MGNFSMIIMPYESTNKVHAFFAPEQAGTSDSKGDQHILLIPFCEKTATVKVDAQTTPSPASEKHSDDLKINKNPQQATSAATIDPSAENSSNPSTEYIEAERETL